MGSKRPCDTECDVHQALLMNVFNGETYPIENKKEFTIGRAKSCSIIIEELYISRRHCVIHYNEGRFLISNYNNGSGTFLNCKPLPKNNDISVVLEHGDLISFSVDSKQTGYVYKFCLSSKLVKKLKLDDFTKGKIDNKKQTVNIPKQNNGYVKALDKMQSEVTNLKIDKLITTNQVRSQLLEFQKLMNGAFKYTEKFRKEADKEVHQQKVVVENLLSKVSEYQEKLRLQQDIATEEKESSIQMFKNQVFDLLENDCQCPICNEIIFKPLTANCRHTYCECCITRWLNKNQICPVCRSKIYTTNYSLVMDNFITNLCDLLGGSAKLQRDNIRNERSNLTTQPIPINTCRRGRRRGTPAVNPRGTGVEQFIVDMDAIHPTFDRNIPIVDLTNSFGPTP